MTKDEKFDNFKQGLTEEQLTELGKIVRSKFQFPHRHYGNKVYNNYVCSDHFTKLTDDFSIPSFLEGNFLHDSLDDYKQDYPNVINDSMKCWIKKYNTLVEKTLCEFIQDKFGINIKNVKNIKLKQPSMFRSEEVHLHHPDRFGECFYYKEELIFVVQRDILLETCRVLKMWQTKDSVTSTILPFKGYYKFFRYKEQQNVI